MSPSDCKKSDLLPTSSDQERDFKKQFNENLLSLTRSLNEVLPGDIYPLIAGSLNEIAKGFFVDRVSLFLLPDDREIPFEIREWSMDVGQSVKLHERTIPAQSIPWLVDQMENTRIVSINRSDELPFDQGREKKFLQTGKIKTFFSVPLRSHHSPLGSLAFQNREKEKVWKEEEKEALSLLGEIVCGAMKKQRTERDLVNLRAESKAAVDAKTNFLASVSHELQTPLNAIINFSEQVIEDWDSLDQDSEWNISALDMLNRSHQAARRLHCLIQEMLDLVKIESGRSEVQLAPSNIKVLLTTALEELTPKVRNRKILLKTEFPDNFPLCQCDERLIKQAIQNLLDNAAKFTEEGEITLRLLSLDSEFYAIEVEDEGIGISPKTLKVIFDLFHQADSSGSRRYEGVGLGLTLVREIVELHKGTIEVKSQQGRGTTFHLKLPFSIARKGL